jgi:chromosome segregation ATPase
MEFEQIVNQLNWLDEEHRKDKETIAALQERLTAMESGPLSKQVKKLDKQLSEMSIAASRMKQLDDILAQQRSEMSRIFQDFEKRHQQNVRETEKRYQIELEGVNKILAEYQKTVSPHTLKMLTDEDAHLAQIITELMQKVNDAIRSNDEAQRAYRGFEESRRQDAKRATDMQGEMTALRKHVDEHREKLELNTDTVHYLDTRVTELLTAEGDRKQSQVSFVEQIAAAQAERDRSWKEWQSKYENFKKQTESVDAQMLALDETFRSAMRAHKTYEELNQRIERRINEVSETHRLTEERLRQEWVTYKSDEQKRWTGYTLLQEETTRELRKKIEKLEERSTSLNDTTQTLHDQLQQTTSTTEEQMQELMNWAHELLTAYERIMGHSRKVK